jgi:hypothetical protein
VTQGDGARGFPVRTLSQVLALERPARHRDATCRVDYVYDGVTFWCDREWRGLRPGAQPDEEKCATSELPPLRCRYS